MSSRSLLSALAAALLLTACASTAPTGISHARVPDSIPKEYLHFSAPTVDVGDPAPDFELPTPEGDATESLAAHRGRPVALIFASYT